jgi:hypothetical protein
MPVGLAKTFAAKPNAKTPVMMRQKAELRRKRNDRIKILIPKFTADAFQRALQMGEMLKFMIV